MNEIKIEKGIPMPAKNIQRKRGGMWVNSLRRMEVGDSIVVPAKALTAIYQSCKRNGWKVRIQTQPIQSGETIATVRLWLLKTRNQ